MSEVCPGAGFWFTIFDHIFLQVEEYESIACHGIQDGAEVMAEFVGTIHFDRSTVLLPDVPMGEVLADILAIEIGSAEGICLPIPGLIIHRLGERVGETQVINSTRLKHPGYFLEN